MKSVTTHKFRKAFNNLSLEIQQQAEKKYELFAKNSSHPSLRFKKVVNPDIYSVRITRDYRALGVKKRDRIIWFWIGTHSEYEKLLNTF